MENDTVQKIWDWTTELQTKGVNCSEPTCADAEGNPTFSLELNGEMFWVTVQPA